MIACFIGDSFTHGVGDEAGLGWRGRIVSRLVERLPDLTAYDLGIRRDTSADIVRRWEAEALARLAAGHPHLLAFCFGTNDCADDGAGERRVPEAETLRNARAIFRRAAALAPTIVIGPPPILDAPDADRRIALLEPKLEEVARGLGLPFLPVFGRLGHARAWTEGAAKGDGTHPDGAGYAYLADMIWDWPPFRGWTGGIEL